MNIWQILFALPRNKLRCLTVLILYTYKVACAPVPPAVQAGTTVQCSAENRNPCVAFPDLCSTGGGRCIVKGPCEYQCLCPPDSRVGRDCTSTSNPEPGSVVDTLLIFPKDFLLDVNHVAKSEDFIASNSLNKTARPTTLNYKEQLSTNNSIPESTNTILSTTEESPSSSVSPLKPVTIETAKTSTTLPTTTESVSTEKSSTSLTSIYIPDQNTAAASTNYSNIESSAIYFTNQNPDSKYRNQNTDSYIPSTNKTQSATLFPRIHSPGEITTSFIQATSSTFQSSTTIKTTVFPSKQSIQTLSSAKPVYETSAASDSRKPVDYTTTKPSPSNSDPSFSSKDSSGSLVDNATVTPKNLETLHKSTTIIPNQSTEFSSPKDTGSEGTTTTSSFQEDIFQTLKTQNQMLFQLLTDSMTSFKALQPQQAATQHETTTTATTTPTSTDGIFTPTTAPSSATNSNQHPPEEFPTLFNVDNSLSQSNSGVNSPLNVVVHRVFVPIEQFETVVRS